ncbi:MAG: hypothetical protein HZC01_04515 [Candidatus Kerfeldbacteria bacterium]|nr:hypothetical protein [Candidatus Kerfeldbacteria bacterium]
MRILLKNQQGVSLLEVLIAGGIFALVITVLVGGYITIQSTSVLAGSRERAIALAEEGIEAVRSIRDSAYLELIPGVHGLQLSGGHWTFAGTFDTREIFSRSITLSAIDANTMRVESRVAWDQTRTRPGEIVFTTDLTNWHRVISGGWSVPSLESSIDLSNTQDGLDVEASGDYAYIVRNGGTADYQIMNITNTATPTIAGTINTSGNPFHITVSSNYSYVTTASNTQELVIINHSNPVTPSIVGTFNPAGNADGQAIAVAGTHAYMSRAVSTDPEFYVVDVANPAAPAASGSLQFASLISDLVVVGNYAYAATASNTQELLVINVANPAAPTIAGAANLTGITDAISVAAVNNILLIGRTNGLVHIIDITTPTAPVERGVYNAQGTVPSIAIKNDASLGFLGTGFATAEFQVIDLADLTAPVLYSSVDYPPAVAGLINGMYYHAVKDRAIGVGPDNAAEFFIFKPQ